jgi:hypothetical protein
MSKTVYLIGHGRVDAKTPINVPDHITAHWLARLGDVTAGLSNAFLSGALGAEYGQPDGPQSSINEHYLCSDMDFYTDGKIVSFFGRAAHPHASADPYFLYTRPNTDVKLSSIFTFLLHLGPSEDWHIYWTCCRGFIGVNNAYKTEWSQGGVVRTARNKPPATPKVGTGGHTVKDASFESVVLLAKSDQQAISDALVGKSIQAPTNAIKGILRFR